MFNSKLSSSMAPHYSRRLGKRPRPTTPILNGYLFRSSSPSTHYHANPGTRYEAAWNWWSDGGSAYPQGYEDNTWNNPSGAPAEVVKRYATTAAHEFNAAAVKLQRAYSRYLRRKGELLRKLFGEVYGGSIGFGNGLTYDSPTSYD